MMEVLVKEQAAVQRDWFVSFKLLEWIAEALERLSARQAGVVPTEGLAVGRTEAERVRTPLFLMDLDPVDLLFALVTDKDSEEDSGCGSENEGIGPGNTKGRDENKGCGNTDEESGSEDGDAMVE
jgi:hypothetical protein